jgi:hypothetical protein
VMLILGLGHCTTSAPLAQLAEQLTLNQWVPGSSPGGCTKSSLSLTSLMGQKPQSRAEKRAKCFRNLKPGEGSKLQKRMCVRVDGAAGCAVRRSEDATRPPYTAAGRSAWPFGKIFVLWVRWVRWVAWTTWGKLVSKLKLCGTGPPSEAE